MGKTNTCILRENERQAEKRRKHKCMYGKAEKGYKERERTIERDKMPGK